METWVYVFQTKVSWGQIMCRQGMLGFNVMIVTSGDVYQFPLLIKLKKQTADGM